MTQGQANGRVELEQIVRRLAAEQAGRAAEQVRLEDRFEEDLDFDSLAKVEFVIELEDALGVSIPDEGIERTKTVGEAVELAAALVRHRSPAGAAPAAPGV